ncbi:unnamed protein product, partial [marine sediment metagenome]
MAKQKINVKGTEIVLFSKEKGDYISLTDIARYKDSERSDYILQNWMRNRSTIEFIGLWEQIHNPNFNSIEFDGFKNEAGETNKFVLDFISELRERPEDKRQLSLFKPDDFVESKDEIIRPFVKGDTRPPYVVNTSKLKSPQSIVLVSHSPEKEFVFHLIEDSDYIDSWIKSPDKNFYSIDYEYWKGGKDRVRRSFNPDFFIKIDLDAYISKL